MGENVCKCCNQPGLTFQNIQIAHTGQYQKTNKSKQTNPHTNNPIKKQVKDLSGHISKDKEMAKPAHEKMLNNTNY